jgi:hypothetical protein
MCLEKGNIDVMKERILFKLRVRLSNRQNLLQELAVVCLQSAHAFIEPTPCITGHAARIRFQLFQKWSEVETWSDQLYTLATS